MVSTFSYIFLLTFPLMKTSTLFPLSMKAVGFRWYPQSARYIPTVLYDVQDTIRCCHDPVSDILGQVNYFSGTSFVGVLRQSHCIPNLFSSGQMLLNFLLPNTPALILPCLYCHHTHPLAYILPSSSAAFPIIPLSLLLYPLSRLSSSSLLILP